MNYQHMKGPGDLPGDSRNPNSPDYSEPVFDSHDAAAAVAADLWRNGDIPEILEDLADQFVLLGRLSQTWPELGHILPHSARLSRLIDKKLESLHEEG
jgi:hypothetical protein